jgi:hypothetical protein
MTKALNLLAMAMIAVAAIVTPASAAGSLPPAMLGTWCTQEDDQKGTPMKRCAPGAPNVITMRRHVIDTAEGPCRVVSVRALSATRWVVSVDCEAEPDRTYGWQFFRDGETLYLTPVGGFVPK